MIATSSTDTEPGYSPPNKLTLVVDMQITTISPSPLNPRKHFDPAGLQELAESIKTHGLLEPIVVRALTGTGIKGPYQIIAGERRYHAAKLAGLELIPTRVLQDIDDRTHIELALLENLQRQDLDPLEEAAGYKALADIGYTQTQIAAAVKRSQPAVAKTLSLTRLPDQVQDHIRTGRLTPTHGVALARYADFPAVCTTLAAFAIERKATSQDLEGDKVPFYWEVARTGVARLLNAAGQQFSTDICKSRCPYHAYRAVGYSDQGLCLRPDHYDELQAEAEAAHAAQRAEAEAAAATSGHATGTAAALPALDSLHGIRDLRYHTAPSGCTPECPCRAQAADKDGRTVAICTNSGHFAELQVADQRAAVRSKRDALAAQRRHVDEMLAGLQEIGPRELALVATAILERSSNQAMRAVANKIVPGLGETMASYGIVKNGPALLARQEPLTIVRLALAVLLHGELLQEYTANTLTDWYMTPADLPPHAIERIAKLRAKIEQSHDVAEIAALRRQIADLQARKETP